jgi:hypothetical protein
MKNLNKLGMGLCWVTQGAITLGVMVIVPVGWFFFGWDGPATITQGESFLWKTVDVMLWMLSAMIAMFATSALSVIIERLNSDSE